MKKLPLPAVAAALGMAAAYYGYPFLSAPSLDAFPGRLLLFGPFFLFVLIAGFLAALRNFPGGKKSPAVFAASVLAAAAAAGFALGFAARSSAPGPARIGIPIEKAVAVSGLLREDPRTLQGGGGFGSVELLECRGPGGLRASAKGSLAVFFPRESIPRIKEFGRGCEIYAEGVFSVGERGLLFGARSVHIVKPAPAYERFRTGLRLTLLDKFQNAQGRVPVWGSLASALLLGVRDDLNADFADGFRNSGCSHILALSGMHLAIISAVLAFLLRRPLGARMASLAGAVFIVLYVFIAGSQPSLARAAIMYLIGAFALWTSLKAKPVALLAMAFIAQLLFQNATGVSYSFILSYLALAGILTLGEKLRILFRGRLPEIAAGGVSASLGAFIASAPAVALFFGSLRPVGIVAGLILAPICSLFMVLSLGALIAAFLPFPVWAFFDVLLTWLYRLLEFIVSLAARVPGVAVSTPVLVLAFSALVSLAILLLEKKDSAWRNSVAPFG